MNGLQLEHHKLQYHPERVADLLACRAVRPIYAEISPTSVCNHRCLFCNFNYLGHSRASLPEGRMQSLVGEFAQGGIKSLVFAGAGEPSLHPDTFPAIRRAKALGLDAAMSTNGVPLSYDQLSAMAELLAWVRFSINGGTPAAYAAAQGTNPGDFDKALASLEKLARLKAKGDSPITIGAQCVLVPENRESIKTLAERVKDAGADYFSVKHFYPHADNPYRPDMSFLTKEYVADLQAMAAELAGDGFSCLIRDAEDLVRTRPYQCCFGLPFIVYARENGMLHTCFSHLEDGKTAAGNLLEQDFPTLWSSPRKDESLAYINRSFDKNLCQANCRHHQINSWLWRLKNPPAHVNFI